VPRLKLKRFKVKKPSAESLATYYRVYNPKDLYYRPATVTPVTSAALFGNDHPLALDLGCGRGEFVVGQAIDHPDVNFVGIDRHIKSLWDGVNRAESAELANVRFIKADVRLIFNIVPDESVSEITMLFPPTASIIAAKRKSDPLPEGVLLEIHRALEPRAAFHFVSDHADYFAWKETMIAESGLFEIVLVQRGFEGGRTRFQRIWEEFQVESRRLECRKRSGDPSGLGGRG
jgi:tRNA (guanine-N7-)-methyltransferase